MLHPFMLYVFVGEDQCKKRCEYEIRKVGGNNLKKNKFVDMCMLRNVPVTKKVKKCYFASGS